MKKPQRRSRLGSTPKLPTTRPTSSAAVTEPRLKPRTFRLPSQYPTPTTKNSPTSGYRCSRSISHLMPTMGRSIAPAPSLREHHREVAEDRQQHARDRVAHREADPRHRAADLLGGLARRT